MTLIVVRHGAGTALLSNVCDKALV
jgi:hypothetical protein